MLFIKQKSRTTHHEQSDPRHKNKYHKKNAIEVDYCSLRMRMSTFALSKSGTIDIIV